MTRCAKKRFRNYNAATRELLHCLRRLALGEGNRGECRIYRCRKCRGAWHLTSAARAAGR